jgi:hypothetical protein
MRVRAKVRDLLLLGSGLTFGSIGVLAIFAPRTVASAYGFDLQRVETWNEFRAVFTGFWLALLLLFVTAVRRKDVPVLGNLCGAALLLQAGGRALSFALDGIPAAPVVGAFFAEALAGAAILALRPAATREIAHA